MEPSDKQLLESPDEELFQIPPEGSDRVWCCLYTRPRHEKSVALTCRRLDVDLYLPLRRVVHHYKSGKKIRWLPLFPGYVFCRPATEGRIELSHAERVLSVINVDDQERFTDELLQIFRGLQVSAELDTVPYLAAGQSVEIVRGPFRGIRGVVERVKGRFRVMLIATMMERSIPLEADISDVEPVDELP